MVIIVSFDKPGLLVIQYKAFDLNNNCDTSGIRESYSFVRSSRTDTMGFVCSSHTSLAFM